MTYHETLDYLYTRLPMFTRDGVSAMKKDLTNTLALCRALGNPQDRLRTVHVAGTNGKGSTSHTLAAILQEAGYRTGLYTSPHLVDFRERIRVDGAMIPHQHVIDFVQKHRSLIEEVQPSFFEVTVVLAFDYFVSAGVDVAVIETGLGGRLDSTNVIRPSLSVITNIGMDHSDILGDTLAAIAAEKAGIIKRGIPVVISEYQEEIADVFKRKAKEANVDPVFASEHYAVTFMGRDAEAQQVAVTPRNSSAQPEVYRLDLQGSYQVQNLVGILSAVDSLRDTGWTIPEQAVRTALSNVQRITGLQGRWQTLSRNPLLICDTGHNADGWRVVLGNIKMTPHERLHMVLGVMKDKDLHQMLPLLPRDAIYYFCQVAMPRALPSGELVTAASSLGLQGRAYASVEDAVRAAQKDAAGGDLIFVGGSTFVVGELLSASICN